jgi:hypothetical protein
MLPGVPSRGGFRGRMTRHDQLFKTLFQSFLADLLSLAEPEALGFLDMATLRLLDKETFTGWPGQEHRENSLARESHSDGRVVSMILAPARSHRHRLVLTTPQRSRRPCAFRVSP